MSSLPKGPTTSISIPVFLGALLVSISVKGDTVGTADGLQILKQAESTLGQMSFYAKCDWGGSLQTMVLQKKGVQGRYLVKKEIVTESLGYVATNEFLINDSGEWQVLPQMALRMDFLDINNKSAFCGLLENGLDTSIEAEYGVEQKQINGREMFSVSQTPTSEYRHIVQQTILVGRDDHIIYGYTSKASNGAISTMTVTEFRAQPNLSDDAFMLPTEIEEVICTNALQFGKLKIAVNKAIVRSPSFKEASLRYHRRFRAVRYTIFGLMIASTICLMGYYGVIRYKTKSSGA